MIPTPHCATLINTAPLSSAVIPLDIESGHAAPARHADPARMAQVARLPARSGRDHAGDAKLCLGAGAGVFAVGSVFVLAGATNQDSSSRVGAFYTASLLGVVGLSALGKGVHYGIKAVQQSRSAGRQATPAATLVNAGRQAIV